MIKEKWIHFKNWFIVKLGGVPTRVNQQNMQYMFFSGQHSAMVGIKQYMDSINGTEANEWCKLVYKFADSESQRLGWIIGVNNLETNKEVD